MRAEAALHGAHHAPAAQVELREGEVLFRAGEPSEGAFIVVAGRLGVYLRQREASGTGSGSGAPSGGADSGAGGSSGGGVSEAGAGLLLVATLQWGESVGDLDLLDGGWTGSPAATPTAAAAAATAACKPGASCD